MAEMQVEANVPSQTLYVRNINEKVQKEVLKKALYECFSQFGPIMDIVAMKTIKMRGQAFIVFQDVTAASAALRQMQDFPFYDKPLNIHFARGKSDAVSKADGSFVARTSEEKQKKRKADEERRSRKTAERKKAREEKAAAAAGGAAGGGAVPMELQAPGAAVKAAIAGKAAAAVVTAEVAPNKILFVEGLPDEFPPVALQMLFQQYPGFTEARQVPGKEGIAFIEFENDGQSTTAMNGLQGFKVTNSNNLKISFAKQ